MNQARKMVLLVSLSAFAMLASLSETAANGSQHTSLSHRVDPTVDSKCPSKQETEIALGKASGLLKRGQYENAAESLETFAAAKCDPRVYLLLAAALEGSGNADRATETLVRAHAVWPANTSIATSLAREFMNRGQVDKALRALGDFRVTANTPLQEMQEATVVYIAGHQLVSAQAVALSAHKSHPSLSTLLLLANVLQLEGRFKDVNRLLGEQRKAYTDSPTYLITIAESEFDAMLYDAAQADLESAIALDNESYQAHYLLGNVLVAQAHTDRAEFEYRKAIELDPQQPRTYYQLALMFRNEQDEVNEESLLKQALTADDHFAPAYCELGKILMNQHRLADAVAQLNLAIQYNPLLEQAYFLLARAYAGLGQKDNANAVVKRYTALRAANRSTTVDKHPGQLGVTEDAPQ